MFPVGDGAGSQEDQLCTALVSQLNKFADKETLIQFLRCFLLESNSSSVRWQAHCLALHIYRYLMHSLVSSALSLNHHVNLNIYLSGTQTNPSRSCCSTLCGPFGQNYLLMDGKLLSLWTCSDISPSKHLRQKRR